MPVTDTSREAYSGGSIASQRSTVIQAMRRLGSCCIADLAEHLGWQRSTVSGRMNDLKKAGLLVFDGKAKSKTTGITAQFFSLDPNAEVKASAQARDVPARLTGNNTESSSQSAAKAARTLARRRWDRTGTKKQRQLTLF